MVFDRHHLGSPTGVPASELEGVIKKQASQKG